MKKISKKHKSNVHEQGHTQAHEHAHNGNHEHNHEHTHEHGGENKKWNLARLIIGGILFAIALFLPNGVPKAVFCGAIYLLVGYDVIIRAVKGRVILDENVLMMIATIGAFVIGDYAEGLAVMLFFQVGEYLQELAVVSSRASISSLMDIRVDNANRMENGTSNVVPCEQIRIGDTILVRAGEKIPLDGIVMEGKSTLDTAALTGESMPMEIAQGDEVLSGVLNLGGALTIKVTKEFGESTVSKILDLVENAASKKSPTENFITKFSRYYTPVVMALAVLIAVIPSLMDGNWSLWVYRGLSFLVVSCPCALVISVPLSFFGGIGGASKNGILIKGSNYMEALSKAKTVVFDKTGTLTEGTFAVTKIQSELPHKEFLKLAAQIECSSTHPIAKSILEAYGAPIDQTNLRDVKELAGLGIGATIEGVRYYAGNQRLMETLKIPIKKESALGTSVYVANETQLLGQLLIKDSIKKDTVMGLEKIRSMGITDIVMLTGDTKSIGTEVANTLAISQVFTELLPADKVQKVEELIRAKENTGSLIFAGDGINDAPVLAMADVGIAMGGIGSDAAIEAADVVLMTDQITKIPLAIQICRKTLKIVKENIALALFVKVVVLIVISLGYGKMWMAIFADVGVTLLAVLNALRCLKTPTKFRKR